MAKLSRTELKGIVKECLMEILTEGLRETALEINEAPRSRKRKVSKPRQTNLRPAADNVRFTSAVETTVNKVTNDPLMASLLSDTASTTLQEQINHGDKSSLSTGGTAGIPIESPDLDIFSGASQNCADLAFGSPKKSSM